MAITVTKLSRVHDGNRWTVCAQVAMSNSYVAGGEAITADQLGLSRIESLMASNAVQASGALQVSIAPILSGTSWKLAAAWDRTPAAAQPLAEVTAATDLSTYTCIVHAVGI